MTRRAFSLPELLLILACLAALAAILLPCLVTAREAGLSSSCLSHVRESGQALALYCEDYDGTLPVYASYPSQSPAWWNVLPAYSRSAELFRCPSVAAAASWGEDFGVNFDNVIRYPRGFAWVTDETAGPARLDQFARPAETLVLTDGTCGALYDPAIRVSNAPDWGFAPRHRGGVNVLWLDGRATWSRVEALVVGNFWGRGSGGA